MSALIAIYITVGGAWAFAAAMVLLMGWGEEKITRPAARALIVSPVWPIAALVLLPKVARFVWSAAGWGKLDPK